MLLFYKDLTLSNCRSRLELYVRYLFFLKFEVNTAGKEGWVLKTEREREQYKFGAHKHASGQ